MSAVCHTDCGLKYVILLRLTNFPHPCNNPPSWQEAIRVCYPFDTKASDARCVLAVCPLGVRHDWHSEEASVNGVCECALSSDIDVKRD